VQRKRLPRELRVQLKQLLDAKLLKQLTVIGAMAAEGERLRAEKGVTRPPAVTLPEEEEGVTE
jgi:hypothetical protein